MSSSRWLIVTADDFGIGPATSAGILDLARAGLVTATVLLVNSPFAAEAVEQWRNAGRVPELGWHPCLTLDAPVLPPEQVSSLIGSDGRCHSLGTLLRRLLFRRIRFSEVVAELTAQLHRFVDMTGQLPVCVNGHHHIHVFPTIGPILRGLAASMHPSPYWRRVRESWQTSIRVPGARLKRTLLSLAGRCHPAMCAPGNDYLIGVTDPRWVEDPGYLVRWLRSVPGRVVELTCHPGHLDPTLLGRDGGTDQMRRRVVELAHLRDPCFLRACHSAGFTLIAPGRLIDHRREDRAHAA